MNPLVISLTGKITETNFDEWKQDLLAQIDGIQKVLKTDGDFALATDQAKSLKQAELALKKAKESAIEQAADIQRLFAAIDEVSAAARKARLFLEGQIKERKQEIKDAIITTGIRKVRALIEEQSDDFRLLDPREFTDRGLFEDAIKGKRGIEGMDAAVQLLLDQLRQDIANRAAAVEERARKLASMAPQHQPLFQDRAALLSQPDEALEATIAERIDVFTRQQAALAEAPVSSLEKAAETEGSQDDLFAGGGISGEPDEEKERARPYRILLSVLSTEEQARQLLTEIRGAFGNRDGIQGIVLEPEKGQPQDRSGL